LCICRIHAFIGSRQKMNLMMLRRDSLDDNPLFALEGIS
jgi:hypothetical protein